MNPARIRIAMFVSDTVGGGVESLLRSLLGSIDRKRFEIVLVTTADDGVAARLRRLADDYHSLGTGSCPRVREFRDGRYRADIRAYWRAVVWLLRSTVALARWLRRARPQAIHAHVAAWCIIAAAAGKLSRTPMIWHVHCPQQKRYPWSRGGPLRPWLTARLATRFVAVSTFTRNQLPPAWQAKTIVIHNCTDIAHVRGNQRPGELRRLIGIEPHAPLVGIVALVSPRKGLTRFVDMAGKAAARRADLHFLIVAGVIDAQSEHLLEQVQRQASDAGLDGRIHVLRNLPDASLYMSDLSAFFMCSLPGTEPFGLVLTEAMAAGTPVVAYANDAAPEILTDGETGLLIPEGDVEAAAAAVCRVASDPVLAERLRTTARTIAEERFGLTRYGRELGALYETLAAAQGGGRGAASRPASSPSQAE